MTFLAPRLRRLFALWLARSLWLGLLLLPASALAHRLSDSYLSLEVTNAAVQGQFDLALRDIALFIDLDADKNEEITWDELRGSFDEISSYLRERMKFQLNEKPVPWEEADRMVAYHPDGAYAVLKFSLRAPEAVRTLEVNYSVLFDIDFQHRGLMQVVCGDEIQSGILGPEERSAFFTIGQPDRMGEFLEFIKEGVWHIWIGFDHVLFLLALLLPAVLRRDGRAWVAAESFRDCLWNAAKVVTAFTLAHSITLSLAALNLVTLPSRGVESVIAASVVVAAGNNLFHYLRGKEWLAAFVFGIIHGFGFAGVLQELGLSQTSLAASLAGFNVGVELGQLAIVAVFLPLAFALRKHWSYQAVILRGGSALIALLAGVWMFERAFDVTLPELMKKAGL